MPTLNFTIEDHYDFRDATPNFGYSFVSYNSTDMTTFTGNLTYNYTLQNLVTEFIRNSSSIGPPSSPCEAYNCTYTFKIPRPGYRCQNVSEGSLLYNQMPRLVRKENLVYTFSLALFISPAYLKTFPYKCIPSHSCLCLCLCLCYDYALFCSVLLGARNFIGWTCLRHHKLAREPD